MDKGTVGKSGTTLSAASDWMAFGAAFGHADPHDSPEEHWVDILVKGCLVCKPKLSKRIAYEAPQRLMDLERWGVDFDKTPDGKFKQILSDGARYPRACGKGTETGPVIIRVLLKKAKELGVKFIEDTPVVDLVTDENQQVIGCWAIENRTGKLVVFNAKSTILATGGAGHLYAINVFPHGMTGDGYALAFRAGAKLVNMEFIQIGPSIVYPLNFALSGVFWRLNPKITNIDGEEFIPKYIPPGIDIDRAIHLKGVSYPFTVRNESKWVDLAVYTEIIEGRGTEHKGVYMDISHNDPKVIEEKARIPFNHLLKYGIDIRKDKVQFAPAIQHFNGGVMINERAETSLDGLFACGEVAGGQHGADRPGGNSLADCQVFGKIAGENAARRAEELGEIPRVDLKKVEEEYKNLLQKGKGIGTLDENINELRWLMWKDVGVKRTKEGLEKTMSFIKTLRGNFPQPQLSMIKTYLEYRNMVDLAPIIIKGALERRESRGTHYRADYPKRDDENWLKQIIIFKDKRTPDQLKVASQEVTLPKELGDLKSMLEGEAV